MTDQELINEPISTELTTETENVEHTAENLVDDSTVEKTEEVAKDIAPVDEKAKKAEVKAARQFAEIAKRENELRRKERSVKDFLPKIQEYEKSKANAKANPIKYLQELTGLSFDDIINASLSNLDNKTQDPQKKIEEKLAQIEREREEERTQRTKQNQDAQWNQHLTNVSKFVNENSDKYEVILSHPDRATSIYRELVDQTISLAGRELNGDEVVALIDRTEKLLTNEVQPLFERLSKSKKFSGKIENNKTVSEKNVTDNKTKTLTNEASTTATIPSQKKLLTHEEAIEAIRKQFG